MQPTTPEKFTTFMKQILAVGIPFCPNRKLGFVSQQIRRHAPSNFLSGQYDRRFNSDPTTPNRIYFVMLN